MKRLLSLILALLMCISLFAACDTFDYDDDDDEEDDEPGFSFNQKEDDETANNGSSVEVPVSVDAAALYTNFLVNGGYESLTKDGMTGDWSAYWTVATCQMDLNGDDIPELLVVLSNEEYMGVRGYPTLSALLTVQDGEVAVLTTAEYTGGTLGGEFLYPVQDEQMGKLRIGKYGYWRVNGNEAYFNATVIYDYTGTALLDHFSAEEGYYYIPSDPNAVKDIQDKTDLYTVNGDEFYYWKVDGSYATESDHKAATSCYTVIHDLTAPGTLTDPLNLGNS